MIAIFVIALSLRLFHLWQISRAPFSSVLLGDARAYDQWARQIAAGDWLGHDVFYQAPLYPYALGALYATAGRHLALVRGLQAVGGALACVLLALAATRLFSRRTGIAAGLMLAVYPPAVFFDGLLQKTSLDTLLICLTLWLVARVIDEPGRRSLWIGLGASTGALCLSRENALVFVPVILLWTLVDRSIRSAGRWRIAALFVAGVAVLLVPVAVRNHVVGGGFVLTTSQLGPNFYIGNNPDADGTYRPLRTGRGTAEFERADALELARQATGRPLTAGAVSSYWTGRAFDFITTHPLSWARLMVRKGRLLVNRAEIADTESQESAAEWSLTLRAGRHIGHFGVLLPLAAIGLWLTRGRLKGMWVIPTLAATYAVSVVAFYVFARYRAPLVPFVMLWAAAGLTGLPALVRATGAAASRRAGLLTAVTAIAVLANWPMVSPAAMQAVSENNLGVALQSDGRFTEAIECFHRAMALDPMDAALPLNLGVALQSAGRTTEAADAFVSAVALRPGLGEAHYFLGKSRLDAARVPEAIEHLRIAVPAMPESMEARTALGIALASQGQLEEAIAHFREVVRRRPAFLNAGWNLGAALLSAGQLAEAIPTLEEAVGRDTANAGARADLADAYNRRGIALASRGALAEATADFQAALRLDPGFADARQNLATATGLSVERSWNAASRPSAPARE